MNALADFHWLRPGWLLLLVPALLLSFALARSRARSGSWSAVIDPTLLPHLLEPGAAEGRRRWLLPVLLGGWLLATIAAAGPSWVRLPTPVLQKQDALVVLLDLSYSMWAQDLEPSRIDRARRKLLDLLERRNEGQTGLVAFAGDAHVVTPLTDDTATIANLLPALDPGMMPVAGAATLAAVREGLALLDAAAVGSGRLLLVTDAVAADAADPVAAALAGRDVSLSVLGVGTTTGAPIPLPEGGFLKRQDGSIVIPPLREDTLEALARRAGGRYARVAIDDRDLDTVLAAGAPARDRMRASDRRAERWADMAHWFCLPLVPLLLYGFRRGVLAALVPLAVLLTAAPPARADLWEDLWYTPDQQGARRLSSGDAGAAAKRFEDPRWRGTAAYRAGDYAAAGEHFGASGDADGFYNRGNALARAGRLDEAIAAYRRSLALAPDREDARRNLALVEALRDRRREQQQETSSGQNGDNAGRPRGDGSDADRKGDRGGTGAGDPPAPDSDTQPRGPEPPPEADGETSQTDGGRARNRGADREDGDAAGAADALEQPAPALDAQRRMAEDIEAQQAMRQWLRRVPDDPAGLLREKFRYQSRKRQRQGEETGHDKSW